MTFDNDEQEMEHHLSRISTMWTVLGQAHAGSDQTVASAQEALLRRYGGAVYRYLYSVLRDANAADELAQEFALNFLRGGFKGASPERGRFRDYVKTSLFNLIRSYRKQQGRHSPMIDVLDVEPAVEDVLPDDQTFLKGWRDELLARTWESLAEYEKENGRLYHTMLKYRTRHADVSSAQMADVLGKQLGKPLTAANVRQTIHRAREKFGDLLIEEVARSLETASTDQIEQELLDLGLLSYCEEAVNRWKGSDKGKG